MAVSATRDGASTRDHVEARSERPRGRATAALAEMAGLALMTAAAAVVYIWTKAPLYNPVPSIDPWLYTALWTNFDQIYHSFSTTYYASRLPWIVPGYVLNLLFDHRTAYFVVHVTFFFAGAVLLYLLCRRYFGAVAAACAYIALVGSQMYFNAHRWDYQEGAVITLLIASVAFALPTTRSPHVRALSIAASGFFSAALVTTRILDGAYLIGLPLLYWAVMLRGDRRQRLRRIAVDLASYATGAVTLLVGGGLFARANGAEFFFFMPQVRVILSTTGEYNQLPVSLWLPAQPYFFVPIFAVVLAVVVLAFGRDAPRTARRLLAAAAAWTAAAFGLFAAWEFGSTGWVFEFAYYFSSFLVPTVFCLAASFGVLLSSPPVRAPSAVAVTALVTVGVLAPVAWIYRSDSAARMADAPGHQPHLVMALAMVCALLLVALLRLWELDLVRVVAVAAAAFAVSYGVDASNGTYADAGSDPDTGALYDLGQKTIDFLRDNAFGSELPYFWYDIKYDGGTYGTLQSLYYYSYTYIGINLPTVDADFRSRMRIYRPRRLVLLCSEPTCAGAPQALARAGFPAKRVTQRRLEVEPHRVFIAIYRFVNPPR